MVVVVVLATDVVIDVEDVLAGTVDVVLTAAVVVVVVVWWGLQPLKAATFGN